MKILSRVVILTILISISQCLFSQNKYWIFFTDKDGESFNPYEYFDKKAIERRVLNGISLYDPTDFPVKTEYINSVRDKVDSTTKISRWFNCMAVYATQDQLEEISKLAFVKAVEPMFYYPVTADYDTILSFRETDILNRQTETMGRKYFEEREIDGKGIRIAIFDGGFPAVNTSPAFEHIRKDNRIIKTWDFTKNKENVYLAISHGTNVMSCIGGIINGQKIGLATGAEFLLARTEVKAEPYSEEENWLAAVEWADKNGADIINSSLGYTYHRYFPEQMNGKNSLVAKAANLAAKKGILVVNAAGNEGTAKWKIIGTPADADSVLSIGGIAPGTGYHTSFSSYGPTTDGRMKPNVCAFGHVVAASKKGMNSTQGTSFASPLVAGFAACAWQMNRDKTNMEMFHEIEKSGSLYPYFDYAHGFGVPQAKYFTNEKEVIVPTFDIINDDGFLIVTIDDNFFHDKGDHLFYNIQGADGLLEKYFIIAANQIEPLKIDLSLLENGQKINIHYLGFTMTYIVE